MTKPIYETVVLELYSEEQIKRTDVDGTIWFIPKEPANSDYQEYLKSLEDNK